MPIVFVYHVSNLWLYSAITDGLQELPELAQPHGVAIGAGAAGGAVTIARLRALTTFLLVNDVPEKRYAWKNNEQLKLPRREGAAVRAGAGEADSGSTWVPRVVEHLVL